MAKVGMISLGCNKNQIDAEIMLSLLCEEGFELSADINNCDVVVVNTCGFIEAARVESIENILEICRLKDEGVIKAVVVTGCMAQRYREQIAQSMPEVDVILGLGANKDIVDAVKQALLGKHMESYPSEYCLPLNGERILIHTAVMRTSK